MNAKDFVNKYLEWSDIKPIPNMLDYVIQGYLYGKAKSIGGRVLSFEIVVHGVFRFGESKGVEEIKTKKELGRLSLIDTLERRTGVRPYKGYFKLVDFWREEDDDSDNELARRLLGINK